METVSAVGIAIAALLVGVLIPVLTELRATLRSARRLVDASTPKVLGALDDTRALIARVDALAASVEPAGPHVAQLAEAAAGLSASLNRLKSGLEMASAVGPAVAAAVKAFHAARAAMAEHDDDMADEETAESGPNPEEKRQ